MDHIDQSILERIDSDGYEIMCVVDPDERLAPFGYSLGCFKTWGAPEVFVLGLRLDMLRSVLNTYCRNIASGTRYKPWDRDDGFLSGFDVTFAPISDEGRKEYLIYANWLYAGAAYPALQLIYPSTSGDWPWEPGASEWFKSWQRLLTSELPAVT